MENTPILAPEAPSKLLRSGVVGFIAGFLFTASFWAFDASGLSLLSPFVWKRFSSVWVYVSLPAQILAELSGCYYESVFSTRVVVSAMIINGLVGGVIGVVAWLGVRHLRRGQMRVSQSTSDVRLIVRRLIEGGAVGIGVTALSITALFVFQNSHTGAYLSWLFFFLLALPSRMIREALQIAPSERIDLSLFAWALAVNCVLAGVFWTALATALANCKRKDSRHL